MTTRSASRSASSNECVVTTTQAPRVASAPHEVPHLEPRVRVEAGGRLVEEEHVGPGEQGGGQRHPLPLAAGHPPHGRALRTPAMPSRSTSSSSGAGSA